MADKRRLRGPGGAIFVPHPTVDESTIKSKRATGEWSEVEEPKPTPKKSTRARKG